MKTFQLRAAGSLVPEALSERSEQLFDKCCDIDAKAYLELALKELNLQKKQLPKLTFTYPLSKENDAIQKIAQVLQDQWREHLGLDIQLEALEIKQVTAKLGNRDYDIGFISWEAYYHSPFCYFDRFLTKTNKKNYTGWENPQFVEHVQNALLCNDHVERQHHFTAAEKVMAADSPLAPVLFWDYCIVASERVSGLQLCNNGALWLETLRLEEDHPSKGRR